MRAPDFKIQHLTLHLPRDRPFTRIKVCGEGLFIEDAAHITISTAHMQAISSLHHSTEQDFSVYIVGSPIYKGMINREKTARAIAQATDIETFIKELNGEFLIFVADIRNQVFKVFTDRFSSYPFFWAANKEKLYGSYNYTDLARACRSWTGFSLRPSKAYEFFKLQRLMGSETHDTLSQCIPSAGILEYRQGQDVKVRRYWQQNYNKSQEGLAALSRKFLSMIDQSVSIRMGPDKTGVFLSGGHDSRIVACYAGKSTTCYTLGFTDNFEVECARRIAKALGHQHVYVELPEDYFSRALEQATYMSGGLYANDHALFIPTGTNPTHYQDVLLHGHGLDYMFQGMYLHTRNRQLLGRPTFLKTFKPFPNDLSRHFIDQISFRLKFDFEGISGITDRCRQYSNDLYQTVKNIEDQARKISADSSALWEYLIFHQPSRHYTFTNILSKRLCGEVRTPSFDNHIYDFYMSLPNSYRLHADIMRKTLYAASREVAEIPAGNHGIAAAWGPYRKTSALIGRKLLRHITGSRKYYAPDSGDRTWPDRNEYIQAHQEYRDSAFAALADAEFRDFIDFIDWRQIKDSSDFLNHEYSGAFLVSILSYYKFYSFVRDGS